MTSVAAVRRVRAGCCLLLVAALAGCDSSPSPTPATQAPGATPGASAGPVSTAGPQPTTVDVRLPPGAQFDLSSTPVPGESEPVATLFQTHAYFFGFSDGHPEALWREGTPWLRTVIDDGAGYKPPAGSSLEGGYFRVVDAAANDNAMVVIGGARSSDQNRPTGFEALPESLIWTTRDGKTFDRIDPRNLLPGRVAIRLSAVVTTASGFVVVGTSMADATEPSVDIVVLRSADGSAWGADGIAHLGGEGTPFVRNVFADGERLVIDTTDQVCDKGAISYPNPLPTGVTQVWVSPDAGASWDSMDLAAAEPVIHQPTAEACPQKPTIGDLVRLSKEQDTEGAIVGLARDVAIVRSSDGSKIGVSKDLATWTQVALPEPAPAGEDEHRPHAQSIVIDVGGAIRLGSSLALVSLENRPDAGGRPQSGGCQVAWWRSDDGGATWSSGPRGRPFSTCAGATWSFEQLRDGSALLFANAIMANTNRGEASFRTSGAGPFVAWDTCVPRPEADCAFATITNPASEAPDWPGIDLSGATVTDAAIPGVQMPKMKGYAALLSGTFGAADLSDGLLSYAVLEGDFRGANLRNAYLFHAIIRADLTGADLDGAELSGLTFGDGAVCPDGNAPTAGATDAKAACRL